MSSSGLGDEEIDDEGEREAVSWNGTEGRVGEFARVGSCTTALRGAIARREMLLSSLYSAITTSSSSVGSVSVCPEECAAVENEAALGLGLGGGLAVSLRPLLALIEGRDEPSKYSGKDGSCTHGRFEGGEDAHELGV